MPKEANTTLLDLMDDWELAAINSLEKLQYPKLFTKKIAELTVNELTVVALPLMRTEHGPIINGRFFLPAEALRILLERSLKFGKLIYE